MKTLCSILTLAVMLAACDARGQSLLGNFQATGAAENGIFTGGGNTGGSVTYDPTPTTRSDYGVFSYVAGSSGGYTFAEVGDSVTYTFTYSDITMANNLFTPVFRTGFDFGSSAFVYHMTSTGTQSQLGFYTNTNGNPFQLGSQVGSLVTDWSAFANKDIRFATGNTIDAEVSLTLDAIGVGTYDYLYEVTYTGGNDTNTASQLFTGVGGNNLFTIFHGANSSAVSVDGNSWAVSAASLVAGQAPTSDIVIDVPTGTQTQTAAGYPTIDVADSVTKTGAGTLVFDATNAYTGPTTVSAGTLEVTAPEALSSSNVTVDTGASLAVTPGTTMRSPSVIVDGGSLSAASLSVDNLFGITSLAINAGGLAGSPAVTVDLGGDFALVQDARVSVAVGSLSVNEFVGGGRVDVGSGEIAVAAGGITASDLRADIIAGRNSGTWTGQAGITSSAAAASGGARSVGYVVAEDGSARVSFAAPGDVDLSGVVDVFDLILIDSSGTYNNGLPAVWSQGDFNYDGLTNVFDIIGIDTAGAYGTGSYFPASPTAAGLAGSVAAVPEPGCVAILLAGGGLAGLVAASRRPLKRTTGEVTTVGPEASGDVA